MDDAMLFKRGKWIDHNKSHPNDKKSPPQKKGAWSGSHDNFWAVATLFKFCKCIDYGECHTMVKKSLLKMGVVLVMWPLFKF